MFADFTYCTRRKWRYAQAVAMRSAFAAHFNSSDEGVFEMKSKDAAAGPISAGRLNIRRFVKSLDTTERNVLMLRYAEGLSISEIMLVLGMPERRIEQILDSVRSRTHALFGNVQLV